MINSYMEDNISKQTLIYIDNISKSESDNFSDLLQIGNLDKKNDFKFADLSYVCLDDCDLRGFDFTGSDLTGAAGKNIKWDETTKLNGANLSGSIFAYTVDRKKFFDREPKWYNIFLRKQKEHWARNIDWFAEKLAEQTPDRPHLIEVAKAICDTTSDSVLRSDLLLSLVHAFDDSDKHRDFLIHSFYKSHNNISSRATIRVLAALYGNSLSIYELLKRELYNPDYWIREAAMRGIISSKYFSAEIDTIWNAVKGFPSNIRRLYVYRAAKSISPSFGESVLEPEGNSAIDFEEPISFNKLERMAYARLINEAVNISSVNFARSAQQRLPNIPEKRILERAELYESHLKLMKRKGVPFIFDHSIKT